MTKTRLRVRSGHIPPIARLAWVAAGLSLLSIACTFVNAESYARSGVSLVWLSNGFLIGVLLCSPRLQWPAFVALGYVIDFGLNVSQSEPIALSAFYSICNMTEVVVAAMLMFPAIAREPDLTQGKQLKSLLLYGVVLAPLTTSSMAATYQWLAHGQPFLHALTTWLAADVLGIAIATPLYFSYRSGRKLAWRSRVEGAALFLLLCGVTYAVFRLSNYPLLWVVLLVLMLLGVRLGFTGSAAGLLLVTLVGGLDTVRGYGPLRPELHGPLGTRILFFQTFVALSMLALYLTEVAMSTSRRVRLRLEEGETRFRSLAEASRDVIILAEPGGRRKYVSPAVTELLGWEQADLVGQHYGQIAHPDDVPKIRECLRELRDGMAISPLAYRCRKRDGNYIWIEATARLLRDPHSEVPYGFVAVLRDISDRKAAEERMADAFRTVEQLAMMDGLTGVANRRLLDRTLAREWTSSSRDRLPLSLLLIDVDHFKAFNDRYGHLEGDECLRRLAAAIQSELRRPLDLLARYGGEEFVAVLPNTPAEGAASMAELVRAVVQNEKVPHAGSPHSTVTVSIGCATAIPSPSLSLSDLLKRADEALYSAKSQGRNRVQTADAADVLVL